MNPFNINDSNYVALQVLDEVVWSSIVENAANAILVIVERTKIIAIPSFAEDLSSVKRVGMENTVYLLTRSDAVCIVSISIAIKELG